jgi:hypothetical protein
MSGQASNQSSEHGKFHQLLLCNQATKYYYLTEGQTQQLMYRVQYEQELKQMRDTQRMV